MANYGTDAISADMHMYLSSDDTLGGEDVMSDTVRSTMVGGGFSQLQGRVFTVPYGVTYGETYHVIIEVDGIDDTNDVSTSDWIPTQGYGQNTRFPTVYRS